MSAGYVIAQLKVTNPENYKEYVARVSKVVKKFGGEYLVRNGEYQVVEGEDNFPRLVIIKFLKLDLDFCICFEHLTDLFIHIIKQNE